MDLTTQYPRSPYDTLGGCVMLGRTIDKARAHNAGRLGDYSYNCPLDVLVFEFLGISHEALAEAVKSRPTDAEVLKWVRDRSRPHAADGVRAFNEDMEARGPVTEEQKAYFLGVREKVAPGRTDIATWFDLIEADEKRLK